MFIHKESFLEKNDTKYFDRRIDIVDERKEMNGDNN
jgi:hypothetical protein